MEVSTVITNTFCPINSRHALSADAEPKMYYCYQCAEHYHEKQLIEKECDPETMEALDH
jgi:hypothetical protein